MGRLNGACVLLEQKLERELLFFACCHHIFYIKPWLGCDLAVQASYQDLCFLKTLKKYEKVDKLLSQVALTKFCQHLWYLSEEIAILSLFNDLVNETTKMKIIANLEWESISDFGKRFISSKEEIASSLYVQYCISYLNYTYFLFQDCFVSRKSKNLFTRLKIKSNFLQESVSSWEENASFVKAKRKVLFLKAVNDTAERAVKLVQDFHGLITADEEQKQFLLHCVQEHRKLYPDCKKETLNRKYPQ
ncbi:uncharacterized protein LOC111620698 [Centruroides sculpturatus]|uniref:uncharacterized protein LOC111620698 n=1 Tax=Centruroides sculpturatus TaxID=218467 RepID=UPI000C6D1AEC|nr:uncharacterized protein LOC111620698 [Centruroides sculpturatus]